jgi:hypothetical protein
MHQGGGNISLIIPVIARLVARGHKVRVMAGPGVLPSRLPVSAAFLTRIRAAGAIHVPFREPDVHPLDQAPAPRGMLLGWTPRCFRSIVEREAPAAYWASVWAENVARELEGGEADVVVADFLLLGALAAAQAARVPSVVLKETCGWIVDG